MPVQPKPAPNVKQAVPFFHVPDIEASLRFYVDGLGFVLIKQWAPEGRIRWCWLELGGAALMLQEFRKEGHDSWTLAHGPSPPDDRLVETRRRVGGRIALEPSLEVSFERRVLVHRATSTACTVGRSSASMAARIAWVARLRRDCIVPSGIARTSADSTSDRPR